MPLELQPNMPSLKLEVKWNGCSYASGAQGVDPAKAVLVSWPLFFFCGGIAVGLEVKKDLLGSLQQLLDLLVCLHASYGTSAGMAGLQNMFL